MLRWQGSLLLYALTVPLSAQEWRPVSSVPSESSIGISLGKPRSASTPISPSYQIQPLPSEATRYQTVRYTSGGLDKLPEPRLDFVGTQQTAYQGAGSAAEEAFNCGQIPGKAGAAPPPPVGGAPAPYMGTTAPPPGSPSSSTSPWYQPIKDCWNKICGNTNNGIPGTWDARSDQQFKDFISPMSNPTIFEDPRSLTEFRFIGTWQSAPSDNALLMGGNIFDINMQGRISINDQWSLILHRLSITRVQTGDGTLGGYTGGTGLNDLELGAKYTFLRDTRSETIMAFGARFDIPIGSSTVLAGSGWGLMPYLSYAQGFLDNWHFMALGSYRFGFSQGSSDFLNVSAHIDYGFFKRFYPLAEVNWIYYTAGGNRQPVNFEGGDLLNIGATDVSGRSLITVALGFRFKFSESCQMGAVYDFPVVGTDMMEKYRIALDLIFRY